MDVALAIERILIASKYFGCTDENTEEQYDKLRWNDKRIPKPTWEEIVIAWNEIKDLPNFGIIREKSELELKIDNLESRLKILEKK